LDPNAHSCATPISTLIVADQNPMLTKLVFVASHGGK
jgi:hypothetical protein